MPDQPDTDTPAAYDHRERPGGGPERDEINRVARLLMAEWERQEREPVNPSRASTFADMARVVIADRTELTRERDDLVQALDRVRELAAAKEREIAELNAIPNPFTGRHPTMVPFVLVSELTEALAGPTNPNTAQPHAATDTATDTATPGA